MDELVVDLQPTIVDVCYAGCHDEGLVRIAVQVYNAGNDNSVSQVPVALYAVEGARRELIGVERVPRHIAGGWVSDTIFPTDDLDELLCAGGLQPKLVRRLRMFAPDRRRQMMCV